MNAITFLTDDELNDVINGCVDGVYPTTQEVAMANELIIARAKIAELKHEVSVLGAKCEEYSWEPHNLERIYRINEIKAQGIEEAIKGFRTFALSNNVDLTCEDFDEYLCEQANKLRTNHD